MPLGPDSTLALDVLGRGGVPATGVSAVVLNVTATGPTAPSFLTVFPDGASRPEASNLNVASGQTIPNLVIAKVGGGGKVAIYNGFGNVDVIADVAGYFPDADPYEPLTPARLLETRPGLPTVDGAGRPAAPLGPAGTLDLVVVGRGGVPATGVDAVVLNVTAVNPSAASFVTVWPTGGPRPVASNLNTEPGVTQPNLVVAKVGDGGRVSFYNQVGVVDVLADVAGYFPTGGSFVPLTPARLLETRPGEPVAPGGTNRGGPIGVDESIEFPVLGIGGVPSAGVSAVVLNVTAIRAGSPSFVTAWPFGTARPTASNLNLRGGGQTVPNLVIAKVGAGGKVALYNLGGRPDLVVDVAGYFRDQVADAREVVTAEDDTCVVDALGRISCWGTTPRDPSFAYPEIQVQPMVSGVRPAPYPLATFADAVDIATGSNHACALRVDGTVWCWATGGNPPTPADPPLVGDGGTGYRWPPVRVPGLGGVAAIDAAVANTCALRTDGSVVCWGAGFGAGAVATPTPVPGLSNVAEIAVGEHSACARRTDGRVLCWGTFGNTGLLGDGSGTDSATPRLVAGLTDATSIHVQSLRACAARTNGQAVCWGNQFLGGGSTGGSLTPVDVLDEFTGDPATGIVDVEGGDDWACALRSTGEVSCWGSEFAGRVGLSPSTSSSTTRVTSTVGGLPPVAAISAGRFHLCVRTTSGDVYCWGANGSGRVGDGTRDDRTTPTLVFSGG